MKSAMRLLGTTMAVAVLVGCGSTKGSANSATTVPESVKVVETSEVPVVATDAHTGDTKGPCASGEVLADSDNDGWGSCIQSPPTTPPTTLPAPPPLTRQDCTATPEQLQFQKNSLATQGLCLHFWAYVFQFDANTGPCAFLGYYGSGPHNRNYNFSDAIIQVEGNAYTNCGLLGPVVDGSFIEVWAVNDGTESYDTTAGGSNTYTKFSLVDIAVYR
jgi:hypothetical protein